MHWTATLRNQTLPDHARVSGDLPCVSCGYNLRRARPDGVCPECGGSVRDTLLAATHPRELGIDLKRLAPTFLAMLAVILIFSVSFGSWMSVVGAVVLVTAGVFRIVSILVLRGRLRGSAAADRFVGIWLVVACLDVAVAILLTGAVFAGLKSTTGAFDTAIGSLTAAWILLAVLEMALVGLLGRALVPVFGYAILRWESMILLGLIVGGFVGALIIGTAVAGLGTGGMAAGINAGAWIIVIIIIPAAVAAAILLVHLGNAAERVREQIEDLLEPAD